MILIPENYRSEALYYFISEDVDKALVDQIDLDIFDISDFKEKRLEVLSKNVIDSLDAYLNALKQFKPAYDKFVNYDRSQLYKLYGFTLYIKVLLGNNSVRGYFCGIDRVQFYNVFDIIKSIDENKTTMS